MPQALEGVAAVGLLYATVRRRFRPGAGLLAGGVLAMTPVAALMFRFNNPDALLVLLLVAAAYATDPGDRGAGRTRWLVLAGALVGFGFITKMLQAFLVVPGFGRGLPGRRAASAPPAARASCSPPGSPCSWRGGWWVAVGHALPAADRPYIGGSTRQQRPQPDLRLQRLRPARPATRPAASAAAGGRRATGARPASIRMFDRHSAARSRWLIPAALILLRRRLVVDAAAAPRTDRTARRRAALGRLAARDRRSSSASPRGSSTPTTRSPSRPPSARWSASAASSCGGSATGWRPAAVLAVVPGGHRRLGLRAARPQPGLAAAGCARRARRRAGRRGRAAGTARPSGADRRPARRRASWPPPWPRPPPTPSTRWPPRTAAPSPPPGPAVADVGRRSGRAARAAVAVEPRVGASFPGPG